MHEVFSSHTVVLPVNYGRQPTPDNMPLQPTSSLCWLSPWPLGSQSTGAHSLWAVTLAPRSQPIYCEWMGLRRCGGILLLPVLLEAHGEFCCFLFFWRHLGNLLLPVLLEALGKFCCFLVPLEALFGRQISWWKVTFFLSSFLLVLLVDCYMVHCPSFASFA